MNKNGNDDDMNEVGQRILCMSEFTVIPTKPLEKLLGCDGSSLAATGRYLFKEIEQTCEQVFFAGPFRSMCEDSLPEGAAVVQSLQHRIEVTRVSELQ
jgi:hypothetical protein